MCDVYVLSGELGDEVQAGETSLQETQLVSFHFYGSEPLRDRTTGRKRWRDTLV